MHRIVPSFRHSHLQIAVGACQHSAFPLISFSIMGLARRDYSAIPDNETGSIHASVERRTRIQNISKSLELYLESLRAHDKMLKHEGAAFELGKRHLANIMGWPSGMTITQDDIDRAIRYLFPSGLTDPKALPVMKPPEEILPKFKKMNFDQNGRPLDPLFYTLKPKFYTLLSDVNKRTLSLIRQHDKKLLEQRKGKVLDAEKANDDCETLKLVFSGSEWMSKEELMKRVLDDELITDDMYASLILALEYFVQLPNSYLHNDFIMSLRTRLTGDPTKQKNMSIFGAKVPAVQVDVNLDRRFAIAHGRVKRVLAEVRVTDGGSGDYTINGYHYSEIRQIISREILLAPLIVTDLLGKVNVSARILEHANGGSVLIPRAVRHGLSLCLAALYPEYRERLRLAGLLTYDPRRKERSKVNQPGARAKWIWKKR